MNKDDILNGIKMLFGKNQGAMTLYLAFILLNTLTTENMIEATMYNAICGVLIAFFGNKNAEEIKHVKQEAEQSVVEIKDSAQKTIKDTLSLYETSKKLAETLQKQLLQAETNCQILQKIIDAGVNDEQLKNFSKIFTATEGGNL